MKTKKFSALQLNKKAIANLNNTQLNAVKGGKAAQSSSRGCSNGGITCEFGGVTLVVQTQTTAF